MFYQKTGKKASSRADRMPFGPEVMNFIRKALAAGEKSPVD